jgi:hypothetical protein
MATRIRVDGQVYEVCLDGKTDGTVNHCGWTHIPPNAIEDYDWTNPTIVAW